ncbi:MAG: hypothetical protein KBS57_05780 [Alistipes sp.]|nr:hypothetical protein [Candidatus Minthomonas equi]
MLKKIITYTLFTLCLAAFGAYCWFCQNLYDQGKDAQVCDTISITIIDSTENHLVSCESVRELISRLGTPLGTGIHEVNVFHLEDGINGMGAIKNTEVAIDNCGVLHIEITQRHPVLRFQKQSDGYYMDDSGFFFPLSDLFTSDVPVVSGDIRDDDLSWENGMKELGIFLDSHPFWHTQIEQINVSDDGTLKLYSRTSDQTILFGLPENAVSKFEKLFAYYRNIAPNYGWDYYSVIDLKYNGQIVCTRRNKKNKQ